MKVEFLGERIFQQELEADGHVWVAKGQHQNVFALELDDTGYSLPIWSDKDRVIEYLRNARLVGSAYEPFPVPLDVFTQAWLSDKMKGIAELLLNMDGLSTRALVLTVEEFIGLQDFKKAS